MAAKQLRIPNRFESVLARDDLNPTPLILPVEDDLRSFERLRRAAEMQAGGVLSFLRGDTGVGKTTAVYSASMHLSGQFNPVHPVSPSTDLRLAAQELTHRLPPANGKGILVLLDGREATDDEVGIRQFLSGVNQLLRSREDLILCWPVTDPEWHRQLLETARRIGGTNFTPPEGDVEIVGPTEDRWSDALERLLIQMDLSLSEIGLDEGIVADYAESNSTIGDFLRQVGAALALRLDEVQLERALPQVLFVVTSGSAVVGEANRLRRAGSFIVKAEELLAYSARSKAGKWWKERLKVPEHHLAYVISLFRSRLLTMTPSAPVYACAEFGARDLREAVRPHGFTTHRGNADRTFQSTDFYRFLAGETTMELTSTRKGKTADATSEAFGALQALSSRRHKAINQAICQLADRNLEDFRQDLARYEVNLGEQDAYADVVVPRPDDDIYLEFHHLSEQNCNAARIAAYVMEKLQTYAIRYNIVPR